MDLWNCYECSVPIRVSELAGHSCTCGEIISYALGEEVLRIGQLVHHTSASNDTYPFFVVRIFIDPTSASPHVVLRHKEKSWSSSTYDEICPVSAIATRGDDIGVKLKKRRRCTPATSENLSSSPSKELKPSNTNNATTDKACGDEIIQADEVVNDMQLETEACIKSPEIGHRRSNRIVKFKIPNRVQSLFFKKSLNTNRNFVILHENPRIYKIRNFLSKQQLLYFDNYCANRKECFERSFTEDQYGKEVISIERTSRYKWFTKSENKFISEIEKKAADVIDMFVDHVEPLQVVSYTKGQRFNEHHDAGVLIFNI
jgi:hypothetical protein